MAPDPEYRKEIAYLKPAGFNEPSDASESRKTG